MDFSTLVGRPRGPPHECPVDPARGPETPVKGISIPHGLRAAVSLGPFLLEGLILRVAQSLGPAGIGG